jgi:2-polyprenyl-6-hydroxyphenyl methylase/3-demethylubiquinone-9 3-methyltransferase
VEPRYAFGKNWKQFLATVDEESVRASVASMVELFGMDSFAGRSFLDVGCGSGLSSLAALQLGADRVRSFDYDVDSVEATQELRSRTGSPAHWEVSRGDVLDRRFLAELGRFDIVYAWGVLHHTGSMWDAIRNAASLVEPGGLFMIGIYNKKSPYSEWSRLMKRVYARGGPLVRAPIRIAYLAAMRLYQRVRGAPGPAAGGYKQKRGMDYWRDLDDWLGGYPFEFASPDEIVAFVEPLGFELVKASTGTSVARVNEFLFRRAGG